MNKTGNVHTNVTLRRIRVSFPCKSDICSHPEGSPVALVMQNAKRKLLSTLWPVITILFSEKCLLNTKCVLRFHLQLLYEKFLFLRIYERPVIINVHNGKCRNSCQILIKLYDSRQKYKNNVKCQLRATR